eukprot:749349-Hanusia_phi.AAC.6
MLRATDTTVMGELERRGGEGRGKLMGEGRRILDWRGVERSGVEWSGEERSELEWSGVEWRLLERRG